MQEETGKKGAGGTPGGVGSFIIGAIMASSGAYLLTNQIQVSSGFFGLRYMFWGNMSVSAFGVTLIPFLIGIGMIFFNGKSITGWSLSILSLLIIIIGVITNLQVYFAPTTLYVTLIILILLVGGIGLILKSIRAYKTN